MSSRVHKTATTTTAAKPKCTNNSNSWNDNTVTAPNTKNLQFRSPLNFLPLSDKAHTERGRQAPTMQLSPSAKITITKSPRRARGRPISPSIIHVHICRQRIRYTQGRHQNTNFGFPLRCVFVRSRKGPVLLYTTHSQQQQPRPISNVPFREISSCSTTHHTATFRDRIALRSTSSSSLLPAEINSALPPQASRLSQQHLSWEQHHTATELKKYKWLPIIWILL